MFSSVTATSSGLAADESGQLPAVDRFSSDVIKASLSAGTPVDLSELSRADRLEVINRFLLTEKLRPLEGILDSSKGQYEITGINGITRDPYKPDAFVVRVDFAATIGNGTRFNHLSFINANTDTRASAVFIPLIKAEGAENPSHLLLVEQGRLALGRSTLELARGFLPLEGESFMNGALKGAVDTLVNELGLSAQEIISSIEFTNLSDEIAVKTGQVGIDENTGTHNVVNNPVSAVITMSQEKINELESRTTNDSLGAKMRVKLIPIMNGFSVLRDNHSLAAFAKYFDAVELPRLTSAH